MKSLSDVLRRSTKAQYSIYDHSRKYRAWIYEVGFTSPSGAKIHRIGPTSTSYADFAGLESDRPLYSPLTAIENSP